MWGRSLFFLKKKATSLKSKKDFPLPSRKAKASPHTPVEHPKNTSPLKKILKHWNFMVPFTHPAKNRPLFFPWFSVPELHNSPGCEFWCSALVGVTLNWGHLGFEEMKSGGCKLEVATPKKPPQKWSYIITCTTTPFKFQQLAVSKPPGNRPNRNNPNQKERIATSKEQFFSGRKRC